jgi:hypothetical protein
MLNRFFFVKTLIREIKRMTGVKKRMTAVKNVCRCRHKLETNPGTGS